MKIQSYRHHSAVNLLNNMKNSSKEVFAAITCSIDRFYYLSYIYIPGCSVLSIDSSSIALLLFLQIYQDACSECNSFPTQFSMCTDKDYNTFGTYYVPVANNY